LILKQDDQSGKIIAGELFTDRGHGEGLVLSEYTSGSWSSYTQNNTINPCSCQ